MKIERADGIALLRMDDGKANAVGDSWLDGMTRSLDALEEQRPSALVVAGNDHFFCGGLNLSSLLWRSREQMQIFMVSFSTQMLRLFQLPFPVVAAVQGSALGVGCVVALQADFRIIADGRAKIGLNEIAFGLGLPTVAVETLRCQVPVASLEEIASEGRLFTPREALDVGIVDEMVAVEELERAAREKARELAKRPSHAYAQIKRSLRAPAVDRVLAAKDEAAWADTWCSEAAQRLLRDAAAKMKEWERGRG